ncbi:MAG: pitrilysin family protein [Candidatus Moranbacteria bacterium]|nr:pitrilysin family protein [Candidatus Moranbacteria bacterium]
MKYKKTTLKNGLRIITCPMKDTQTVTVVIVVGVGSRYETEREAGLSHFIEHMFFKGTQKRPTTLDISGELDSIGGEYNAFTGKDKTGYFAKVDIKHLNIALDVVSDIFLNSKLDEKEIEKERGTIIQELNMYEDTPVMNVGDIYEQLLYSQNPLGREIVGSKKTITSVKREKFVEYMRRFYVANDTIICVAGKFDEQKVISEIKKYFSQMAKGQKPKFLKISEKQKKPAVRLKFKKTDQTHLVLGVRAYNENHPDRFALALLAIILGGNMSSRLFIEIREKRGLAYHVSTSVEDFADCGYLATKAGVEHKNLEITVKTILEEYEKIAKNKVSPKELQKAKDFVKGKSVMGLEASDEVAMFLIDQEARRGRIMTMEEIFRKVDKVSISDILRVAKDIFRKNRLNLAVIGPHKNEKELQKLIK